MSLARTSKAPRNTPGKARTLLIWFGKSLRPVPMTAAPASRARSGMISGTGLAMGNKMGLGAMVLTISGVTTPGEDTPMNRSAPTITSAREPDLSSLLDSSNRAFFSALRSVRAEQMAPLRSQMMASPRPMDFRSLKMAVPAAPAPENTAVMSSIFLSTSFRALMRAAATMMAVPCWSSWKMGMSHTSLSLRSISKQRGAEMSSRLTPPKEPASRATVWTISSTSLERMHSGTALTLPKALKSTHLPSITGIPASGPMSPRPSTAVPSVTTATVFQRPVSS